MKILLNEMLINYVHNLKAVFSTGKFSPWVKAKAKYIMFSTGNSMSQLSFRQKQIFSNLLCRRSEIGACLRKRLKESFGNNKYLASRTKK